MVVAAVVVLHQVALPVVEQRAVAVVMDQVPIQHGSLL
jgi:hypothetical protein